MFDEGALPMLDIEDLDTHGVGNLGSGPGAESASRTFHLDLLRIECGYRAMADNKNQHYVARCHLRPFSKNGEGRAINLFNVDRQLAIADAPLKNQCSEDYFYGDDKRLDDAIKFVEDSYGSMMTDLASPDRMISARDRVILQRFLLLQHLRTEAASERAAKRLFAMHDLPGEDEQLPPLKATVRGAVISAMRVYAETMRIVDDLKLCLVRNMSALDFVTSDNPAILTNRLYLQSGRTKGRGFGLRHAGTLLMMPLSPRLYCILYDGDVYTIAHSRGWIDIKDTADLAALNDHQFLGCAANLYFKDWDCRADVAAAASQARPRRPEQRHRAIHAVLDREDDWGKRYAVTKRDAVRPGDEVLIHIIANQPVPIGWPSFLRYRADRKAYSNGSGTGLVRRWCIDQGFVPGAGYQRVRP